MSDGVKADKYSVALSKGSQGTLYIFTDPSCPHCQHIEPELEVLAKQFSIHLFPVSVIGGQTSSQRIAKLLCAKSENRPLLWKKIIRGEDLTEQDCSEGREAVAANDQVFRKMQFEGTPTIINSAGDLLPDSVPNTTEAIAQWMVRTTSSRE
jgi:TrbB protein